MNFLRLLAYVRLGLVPLALAQLFNDRGEFPGRYETAAWVALTIQIAISLLLLVLAYTWQGRRRTLAAAGIAFDTALSAALIFVYSFEAGQTLRTLLFLVVMEAALFFRVRGGVLLAVAGLPILAAAEALRAHEFDFPVQVESILIRVGVAILLGVIIGRLVTLERVQAALAEERAQEAERLRDELGRRVDVLEAASRCTRALSSSLRLDEAFDAFIGELRALIPFERAAILLVEADGARVMATAGIGANSFLAPGTTIDLAGSVLEEVAEGKTVYREDLEQQRFPEEKGLVELGLRSRVVSPLQLGTRTIGALTLGRAEPDGFSEEEVELTTLLGHFVAAAVQNIRAYEAERTTVDELRRLSALRADFVSLVSHELRSPMAAVIGSARTLQARWRELRPDQREAFLAVIGDETSRLAALIGDVLDTSRIDAGTFGYTFKDVDVADVVREAAAAAELGQEEVRVNVRIAASLPSVRADRERLRQLVDNLISNALKYSETGAAIDVDASERNGTVLVRVRDRGPGIARDDQGLIFEKFGRADVKSGKPGTGLGLFISRSFAEAHGGTLRVESDPGEGATFTLALPVERS